MLCNPNLVAGDMRQPKLSKRQIKERMKDYYQQMEKHLKDLRKKEEEDYDDDDVTDASTYRSMRYCKQISKTRKDILTWAYLIKWGILVAKPGNRNVAIIHPKSGTKIYYMSLSHKARVPKKGYVKMSLLELKMWYHGPNDKYATGRDVPPRYPRDYKEFF